MLRTAPLLLTILPILMMGCTTTSQQKQLTIAPPIPTPAPMGPGQVPPPVEQQSPPPGVQGNIPVPPGTVGVSPPSGVGAVPQVMVPSTPEQARVQATANQLYASNRWLTTRPRWVATEGEGPGVIAQSESVVLINSNLVRSASDGQLAAIMSMQLGDMMTDEQKYRKKAARTGRESSPPPDYFFNQRDGMSSSQAALVLDEQAKFRNDPKYQRERQEYIPTYDSPTCARQALVNAGFSEQELINAQPLLQRYPIIRPAGK